jgi:hypothetical protein
MSLRATSAERVARQSAALITTESRSGPFSTRTNMDGKAAKHCRPRQHAQGRGLNLGDGR